jgi:hypothetical protein
MEDEVGDGVDESAIMGHHELGHAARAHLVQHLDELAPPPGSRALVGSS